MKKNKKIISIILTSFMVFSIVATSLVPTISSYAEETNDIFDKFGATEEDILNQEDYEESNEYIEGTNPYISQSSGAYSSFSSVLESGIDFTLFENDSNGSQYASFSNFCCFVNSGGTSITCRLMPEGSFLTYENGWFYTMMPVENTPVTNNQWINFPSLNYYTSNGGYSQMGNASWSVGQQTRTIDGVDYYYYTQSSSWGVVPCVLSNMPIYYTDGSTVTSILNASNINYSKLGGNEGRVQAHETLRDGSGIWLDNVNCNEGTVYVVVNSDNTQTSSNGYKIRYSAECWYTIELPSTIIAGSSSKEMQSLLRGYGYNATAGSKTTVHGVYYWNDYPYQEIGLSEISANGGIWQESLSATNIYLTDNSKRISDIAGTIVSGSNWTQNAVAGLATLPTHILTGSVSAGGMGLSINNQKLASMASNTDYTVTDIKYNFSYKLYKGDEELGFIEQPYSLVSSTGNTGRGDTVQNVIGSDEDYFEAGTSGMEEGKYNTDYAASNDIRVSNGGSGGSSSSDNNSSNSTTGGSANIGDGAIVINNNPTFNNNSTASADSSSSGFGGFLSTLISLIANGKTSSVETISSISGTTGYTNLVNTYLSSVPTSLWNVIIVTMTAILGITVIGFIVGLLFKIFF